MLFQELIIAFQLWLLKDLNNNSFDDFHHLGVDTRFICNHKLQNRRLLIEGEMCHIIINTENVNKILMQLNLLGSTFT